ncbi:MAG: tetraacyldisaccharide 4'-kinase [Archangium sp.]|nr:tetraacyldisaccharide 4'-kinase [Archangium sp.]
MSFWYRAIGVQAVLLWPFSFLYSLLIRAWHLAFDLGLRKPVKLDGARVISVGNLVAGGSGKTPVVIHLANEATRRGFKVAILTRGYGRKSEQLLAFTDQNIPGLDDAGDEPRLIARRCPGVTVHVGADRIATGRAAIAAGATLLILDDGFQHRRLARDVDLLVDSGEGNGLVIPAGPLREPSSGRKRATHVWKRDQDFKHQVTHYRDASGAKQSLTGKEVSLLLGVARPDLVKDSVEAAGARVAAVHAYADHHHFTPEEVQRAAGSLTTEKDAERLPEGHGLGVLLLDLEVTAPFPLPRGEGLW